MARVWHDSTEQENTEQTLLITNLLFHQVNIRPSS